MICCPTGKIGIDSVKTSMVYRGGDLELRVPQGFSARDGGHASGDPSWLARAFETAEQRTGGTIWVSQSLLAAVNRAYDLAVAHRALEVGLEHLVHALTLIDETAVALERHGIRVATLRRESAAVIAEQTPEGPVNGRADPYTSAELIDTLRQAADSAYQRRSPTTTEDILAVLFDMKRETSSRTLLARHRSDWNLNAPAEPPRERVRVSAGSHIVGEAAPARAEPHSVTDAFQNNRLDALERIVRELAQDVGGDRRALVDLVAELQRGSIRPEPPQPPARASTLDRLSVLEQAILENRAPRPSVATPESTSSDFNERMTRVERSVETKFAELARTWALLGERLQGIEELMLEERPAGAVELPHTLSRRFEAHDGFDGKLKALEHSVSLILDQFGTLERRLDEAGRVDVDLTPVSDRLAEIERRLHSAGATVNVDFEPIEQRLVSIERLVAAGGGVDAAPLDGRLSGIESRAGDIALFIEGFSERIDSIENHIDAQRAGIAQTSATLGSELKALAGTIGSQRASGERLEAVLGDRIQSLLATVERERGAVQLTVNAQDESRARDLVHISGQINALAEGMNQSVEDPRIAHLVQYATGQATQILELQQALATVNTNQQTIAASLDQWRAENAGDLGVIANRLQLMETTGRKPAEMLSRMSTEIGSISQILAHREARKSRFKMWLFGTEDWIGAGWRTRLGLERETGSA